MFGGSMMRDFEEDPFFSMHREHMRRMDEMFRNPFGSMMQNPYSLSLTDGREQQRARDRERRHDRHAGRNNQQQQMMQYDPFGSMFMGMNSMFDNMRSMMGGMQRQFETMQNDPNCHSYSQSSFVSYTNTGDGAPKVYQATRSTRQAPGGIREERKAVRDSVSGMEKMAVGRHINERGHVMTRMQNKRTGEREENEDYLNLDESEAPEFDQEWQHKTNSYHRHRGVRGRQPQHRPAIEHRRDRE